MRRIDRVLKKINSDIDGKVILEVACGCGEFSIAAADTAQAVHCIDLDERRLMTDARENERIHFACMDARQMKFPDESCDTIVIYNAIGHLTGIIPRVVQECLHVLKSDGSIHIISSFKMDHITIDTELFPYLKLFNMKFETVAEPIYRYVRIAKQRNNLVQECEK